MNHLIISRVNLHMRLDPFKYKETELWKRPGWENSRLEMLDKWARASLRKQTNQDFTFVTLWHEGTTKTPGPPNEVQIEISDTGTEDDEPLDYKAWEEGLPGKLTLNFSNQIVRKVRGLFDGPAIVTNLDCDDCLRYDFVDIVQKEAKKYTEYTILDMQTRYQYNIRTGAKGRKDSRGGSPFLSCVEPVIRCMPVIYNHSITPGDISIKKIEGLHGMQTVNESNMFVKGTGNKASFDLSDYV